MTVPKTERIVEIERKKEKGKRENDNKTKAPKQARRKQQSVIEANAKKER